MQFESKIDDESLKRLQSLIGHKFHFLGGSWANFQNMTDQVLVATSGPSVNITSDSLVPTDDPNYLYLEFGFFSVEGPEPDFAEEALKSGYVYLQKRGETIVNIYVSRCRDKNDGLDWDYDLVTDQGILFELATACIFFSFYRSESSLFDIRYFDTINQVAFEDGSIEFELISVNQLLKSI